MLLCHEIVKLLALSDNGPRGESLVYFDSSLYSLRARAWLENAYEYGEAHDPKYYINKGQAKKMHSYE